MRRRTKLGFGTRAVHSGEEPDFRSTGDVVPPIHLSATFARRGADKPPKGLEYSRTGNPTRSAAEKKLASLENADFALAFSSGMAAETTLLLALLKKGNTILAERDLYGGTYRLFESTFRKFGVNITYVDCRDLSLVEDALHRETSVIWLESPTNPLMHICDIRAISKMGADAGAITVVDNTFASPYIQNPLDLGADVVVHSTTKYIGGHSDVIGGSIMTSDDKIYDAAKFNQNALGAVPSPFDCFLVLRGAKTLHLRMERHSGNAMAVAEFLEKHPRVAAVNYPGLKSHPQHALATKQMRLPGGMLSAEIKGGTTFIKRFLRNLKVFVVAESLGGVESLVDHPATMTHSSVPEVRRKEMGISDGLLRFSVGIEDCSDLINDLDAALA